MKTKLRQRERIGPEIPCQCGCGERLIQFDADGRERRFIHGHYLRMLHRLYLKAGGKMA